MIVNKMEKIFTIAAVITDKKDGSSLQFFGDFDTIANKGIIYQFNSDHFENDIKARFNKTIDYHLNISSDFLTGLVDQLGGIEIDNKHIDAQTALEEFRNGNHIKVIEAIGNALPKKNLLLTIPSLLNALKGSYSTDLIITEVIKMALSEAGDLKDWKVDFKKI